MGDGASWRVDGDCRQHNTLPCDCQPLVTVGRENCQDLVKPVGEVQVVPPLQEVGMDDGALSVAGSEFFEDVGAGRDGNGWATFTAKSAPPLGPPAFAGRQMIEGPYSAKPEKCLPSGGLRIPIRAR